LAVVARTPAAARTTLGSAALETIDSGRFRVIRSMITNPTTARFTTEEITTTAATTSVASFDTVRRRAAIDMAITTATSKRCGRRDYNNGGHD